MSYTYYVIKLLTKNAIKFQAFRRKFTTNKNTFHNPRIFYLVKGERPRKRFRTAITFLTNLTNLTNLTLN